MVRTDQPHRDGQGEGLQNLGETSWPGPEHLHLLFLAMQQPLCSAHFQRSQSFQLKQLMGGVMQLRPYQQGHYSFPCDFPLRIQPFPNTRP